MKYWLSVVVAIAAIIFIIGYSRYRAVREENQWLKVTIAVQNTECELFNHEVYSLRCKIRWQQQALKKGIK